MLSRRVSAFVSKRSAQRLLCKQFIPRKCRVCCQLHAQFHAQSELLKQDLNVSFKTDSHEGKDSKEHGENRLAQYVKDEKDKQESHDKNRTGEIPKMQSKMWSNAERDQKKSVQVPYPVYKATKKYLFSDDVTREKFRRIRGKGSSKPDAPVMIEGNPDHIEDLTRKINYYMKKLTCIHIKTSLSNLDELDTVHIKDSFGITYLYEGPGSFIIIGEQSACGNALKEIEGISVEKGYSLPAVLKYTTLQEFVEKTSGATRKKVVMKPVPKTMQKTQQKSMSPVIQEKLGILVERLQDKKPEVPSEQKQMTDHGQLIPEDGEKLMGFVENLQEKKPGVPAEQKQKVDLDKQIPNERGQEKVLIEQVGELKQEVMLEQKSETSQKSEQTKQAPVDLEKLMGFVEKLQEKKPGVPMEQKQKVDLDKQIPKERGQEKVLNEQVGELKQEVMLEQKSETSQKSEQTKQAPVDLEKLMGFVEKLQEKKPGVPMEQKQRVDLDKQIPKERGQEKVLNEQVGELKQEVMLEQKSETSQKSEQTKQAPVDLEKLGGFVEKLQENKSRVPAEQKQKVDLDQQTPKERGSDETSKAVLQLIGVLNEKKSVVKTVHQIVTKIKDKGMMTELNNTVTKVKDKAMVTRDHKKEASKTIEVPRNFLCYVKDKNMLEKIQTQTGATLSFRGDKQIAILGEPENVRSCRKELQAVANHTVAVKVANPFMKKHSFEFKMELNTMEMEHDVTITWMTDTVLFIYGTEQKVSTVKEAIENFFTEKEFSMEDEIRKAFPRLYLDGGYSDVKEKEFQEPYVKRLEDVKEEKVEKYNPFIDMAENLQPAKKRKSQTELAEKVKVDLKPRPPVVTIMGHVDHGKTTLLDALRKSKIVDQEFGGITQHIGAFQVQFKSGHSITFLDTPGHAAFSSMRSRGASVTDIVVLVVAAEDGIMDQTLESIRHAKRAKVPVIVAINKIDLPHADPEKVKYELSSNGLIAEDLGGDVQVIPISALKGLNLDKLQESIIAQAEVLELKADPKSKVKARVIESKVDIGRGKQVTAVVESGTLSKGNLLVSGMSGAKVRQMLNEHGKSIKEAKPGTPVLVTGWDSLPSAGEFIEEVENEAEMKKIIAERERLEKEKLTEDSVSLAEERRAKFHEDYLNMRKLRKKLHWRELNQLHEKRKGDIVETGLPKFPIILKADVDGSLEVLEETLAGFYSEHVELSIVSSGVGDVNEGDYTLAQSVGARIYGFNVKETSMHKEGPTVPITLDNVIYDLFDNMVEDIKETLPIIETTNEIGRGEVLKMFVVTDAEHGKTTVAGCTCQSGMFKKDCLYRIIRNNQVVYEGNLTSMRKLKTSVTTVKEGSECGLGLAETTDLQEKDEVICLERGSQRAQLEWDHGLQHG